MKYLTSTILAVVITSQLFAQTYEPFSAYTSKRFFETGAPTSNDYFFHAMDSNTSGDSVIFDQYYTIQVNLPMGTDLVGCNFWGGTSGEGLDTTWLGNQIKWNTITKELFLQNEGTESLNFDFNLPIGASASFYTSGTVDFKIQHTTNTLETFYGISDSVQIFEIQAFDNGGSPFSSNLNNFEIKLSKNYGLISFINTYDFPAIEQGLELQGQTNPLIGTYQLTYDEAYPWQVGDVIQYFTANTVQQGVSKTAYETWTVTDRIETVDSVRILHTSAVQEVNTVLPSSLIFSMGQAPIVYKKASPIWERPWNSAQMNNSGQVKASENIDTDCSTVNTFDTHGSFTTFCDSCNCYGSFDGFGQYRISQTYSETKGLSSYHSVLYGPDYLGGYANIVYWNINSTECGTFYNDLEPLEQISVSVAPNPTIDYLKIESEQPFAAIRVLDLAGRVIISDTNINSKSKEISVASFEKGAYILEIQFAHSTQTRTIIRE